MEIAVLIFSVLSLITTVIVLLGVIKLARKINLLAIAQYKRFLYIKKLIQNITKSSKKPSNKNQVINEINNQLNGGTQ